MLTPAKAFVAHPTHPFDKLWEGSRTASVLEASLMSLRSIAFPMPEQRTMRAER